MWRPRSDIGRLQYRDVTFSGLIEAYRRHFVRTGTKGSTVQTYRTVTQSLGGGDVVIIKVITHKRTYVVYFRVSKRQPRSSDGGEAPLVTRISASYNSFSTTSSVLHNPTVAQSEIPLSMFLDQKARNFCIHRYVPGNNIVRRVGQLRQDRQILNTLKIATKCYRARLIRGSHRLSKCVSY